MTSGFQHIESGIKNILLEAPDGAIQSYQKIVLHATLRIYLVSLSIGLIASLSRVIEIGWHPILELHIFLLALFATVTFTHKKIGYFFSASFLTLVFFVLATGSLFTFGFSSSYAASFSVSILMAILFLGIKVGLWVAAASILMQIIFGYLLIYQSYTFTIDFNHYLHSPLTFMSQTSAFIAIMLVTMLGVGWLYKMLEISLDTIILREKSLAAAKAELEILAVTDVLTNIPNRRHFFNNATNELARFKRNDKTFTLLMIDLDLFKSINDKYGHAAGDAVLIAFAKNAQNTLREHEHIARIGGEEFAILLPETSLNQAKIAAERIRKNTESLRINYNNITIPVTISIGITAVDKEDETLETILKRADQALYKAKELGRNRVFC